MVVVTDEAGTVPVLVVICIVPLPPPMFTKPDVTFTVTVLVVTFPVAPVPADGLTVEVLDESVFGVIVPGVVVESVFGVIVPGVVVESVFGVIVPGVSVGSVFGVTVPCD